MFSRCVLASVAGILTSANATSCKEDIADESTMLQAKVMTRITQPEGDTHLRRHIEEVENEEVDLRSRWHQYREQADEMDGDARALAEMELESAARTIGQKFIDLANEHASQLLNRRAAAIGNGNSLLERATCDKNCPPASPPAPLPPAPPLSQVASVARLYTFGAPSISSEPLSNGNANDGCFAGMRVWSADVTFIGTFAFDAVAVAAQTFGFRHPVIRSEGVYSNGNVARDSCQSTSVPQGGLGPIHGLAAHTGAFYTEIEDWIDGTARNYKELAWASYHTPEDVGAWRFISSAGSNNFLNEDIVHLYQGSDNQCVLSFRGSDTPNIIGWDDWINNIINSHHTSYCGFDQVHAGFVTELRSVVGTNEYQDNVKPHLGQCSSVTVTGHSLGGALASLFAACVNRQDDNDDKAQLTWTPGLIAGQLDGAFRRRRRRRRRM